VQGYVDACLANNGEILEHVSTANVARDMDVLRAAVGDEKLSYLGFSYGTFLGATYASLFPDNHRAMVLDGPVDADEYINDPLSGIATQTAGFEQALARFTEATRRPARASAAPTPTWPTTSCSPPRRRSRSRPTATPPTRAR
jgi:pimeloyl-ACP methyl ester carboxylesterase